jgi:hypothetical protein
MYANTGDSTYLDDAREMAREAVSKLYYLDFVKICANIGDKCSDDAA